MFECVDINLDNNLIEVMQKFGLLMKLNDVITEWLLILRQLPMLIEV
jgi:hypothetical protein